MSAKHTPGPFVLTLVGDGPEKFVVADQHNVSLLTVVEEGGVQFAAVYEEADALLFATAPELLDALQKAADALSGGLWDYSEGHDEHEQCEAILAEIRSTIAKATGESA